MNSSTASQSLRPCQYCGGRRLWFDGDTWHCERCDPTTDQSTMLIQLLDPIGAEDTPLLPAALPPDNPPAKRSPGRR